MLEKSKNRLLEEVGRLGGAAKTAKLLGVTRATVYNWCDSGNVPLDKLLLLQGAGVDTVYILTGQRSEGLLSADERRLLDDFRAAPQGVQAGVKTTLEAFSVTGNQKLKKAG